MKYSKVNNKDIKFFDELIEGNNVFFDQNTLVEYSHDETEDLKFMPCIVLKPKKELEIEFLYFIATIIREEKWKFTYGRVITPDRLENIKFDLKFYDKQKIIIIRNRILKKVENFLHERSKI